MDAWRLKPTIQDRRQGDGHRGGTDQREPNHRGGWWVREAAAVRIQETAWILLQLKGLLDCHWSLFTPVAVHGGLDGYVRVRNVSFDHHEESCLDDGLLALRRETGPTPAVPVFLPKADLSPNGHDA